MTLRYLNKSDSLNIPNGSGKITFSPPSGQYWIPRFIRVGVRITDFPIFPTPNQQYFAALFHGGTGDTGVDAFVDGTGNGAGDVTAVMNGTLILPGEYLTVDWNILDLGDSMTADPTGLAFFQIIGLTTDDLAEATATIAYATPGPGFKTPLPNIMEVPPAPSFSSYQLFLNPGQNNSIQQIIANPLYVYNVSMFTETVLANADAFLRPSNANLNFFKFSYYDPRSAGLAVPVHWNFHGMKLTTGGIDFVQAGTAAANSIVYALEIAWRGMAI